MSGGLVILCNREDLQRLQRLAPAEIAALAIWADAESGNLCVGDLAGDVLVLRAAPSLCLALASFSAEGARRLDEVAKRLSAMGQFRPLVANILPAEADGLRVLLASEMIAMLRQQAKLATGLMGELASIRVLLEQTQNSFSTFENEVSGLGLQAPRLAFENLPRDSSEIGGPGISEVRQILPISSVGLCSFQLLLGDGFKSEASVALRTIEDEVVHGQWKVPADQIQPGWMTFALSRTISGPQTTAEVVISSASKIGVPYFLLGGPQPLSEFRAVAFRDGRSPTRSLAMRLWIGLPGARLPSQDGEGTPSKAPRVRDIRLFPADLRSVRRITTIWDPPFSVVEALEDDSGIRCHPPDGDDVTVAILDSGVPAGARRFSASAQVENVNAAPVHFGVAYSSLDEDEVVGRIRRDDRGSAESDYVFTGWVKAVHGSPALVSLEWLQGDGHIYFATRMADGASNRFAWSTFKEMRFTTLSTASVQPPLDRAFAAPATRAEAPRTRDVPVSFSLLQSVRRVNWDWDPPFSVVEALADDWGLRCHPPEGDAATVAVLDDALPMEIRQFSALVSIEHAESAPVQFGVAFSSLDEELVADRIVAGDKGRAESDYVFTGWVTADPGHSARVSLPLLHGNGRIYFATRMAEGAANDRAWSTFKKMFYTIPAEG